MEHNPLEARFEVIEAGQLNWTKVALLRTNISHFWNEDGLPARLQPSDYSYKLLSGQTSIADAHKRRLALAKGLALRNYEPEAIVALLDYYIPSADPFIKYFEYLTAIIIHILQNLKGYRPKPMLLEDDRSIL
jgi:hypothetical protein